MRVHLVLPALLREVGHHHHPRHVERGDAGADDGADADPDVVLERALDDLVLRPEAGERRDADDREVAEGEGRERVGHRLAQCAVVPHVDVVAHAVHDRARAEEQVGLEETVGDQVEDRERVAGRAESGREHHVADLAHRRAGQRLLDVVLGAADPGTGEQRHQAHDDDRRAGGLGGVVDAVRTYDEVDARRDHGCRVDEGGHRGRALHRIEQPALQRHLGRLAAGAEQQEQAERGGHAVGGARRGGVDRTDRGGAELGEHQHDRERHAEVADAVDDERLLGGRRRGLLVLPEADQQVRRQTDALPTEEHHQVVGGEHQREHRGDEQVEVREEPATAGIVGHVADRVDVDQRADAGDQQHEQPGQLVVRERHLDVEPAGLDPGEQIGAVRPLRGVLTEQSYEQHQAEHEGRGRGERADQVAEAIGLLAPGQQDRGTRERNGDQQPLKIKHRRAPRTSTGSHRRPRSNDACDRWTR